MTSANTFSELEEMLKAFRCQDLANLLAFAGQTKNGKKSELYDRCINILKKGNPNIQFKLKDIYNSICSKTNTTAPNYNNNLISNLNSNSNSGSSSPDPSMINRYNAPPSVYANSFNQFGHNANNNSVTNGSFQPVHVGVATRSNGFQATTNSLKVQFEKLAFFYLLHELQSPNKMTIMNPNHRPYSYYFQFFMNLDQANEITGAREMIGGKLEYSKQIHLRFGYFESNLQADNLPANLTVNVNGRPASLPAPKPTSKPNADIIRPGRSIDVTHLCKLVPNLPNKVDIQWTNSDPSKQYCVGVYVFKKVSVASLIQHLKQNCVKEAEQTRKMVREKLQITDSDFLIETETLKVNLSCPLMKTRLQLPGRSFKCKHVQCFELESYLMMNEKKPTWNCPVCDQNAPFDDLIIDGLNQEILSKCTDVDEVEFLADGTWKKVNENDKCVAKKSKQEETKKSKINNDDDVEICDISLSPPTMKRNDSNTEIVQSQKQANLNLSNEDQNNKKKDDDCIDLTADSDEEMPLQQNLASIAASLNKVSSASSSSSSNPNELVTTTSVNSISRSSSNNSSIYNQQHGSTEAQVSSDSNQFNDDLSNFRNKSITNNININNNNNKKKEMRFDLYNNYNKLKHKKLVDDLGVEDDSNRSCIIID